MKAIIKKAKILSNQKVTSNYYKLILDPGIIAKKALPGQFVEVKVCDCFKPLLRKPLSIHKVEGNKLELLYEVVGQGTGLLSNRRPGELLDIIGPLGCGFDYSELEESSPILVAGGMGVAPLMFLAEQLAKRKKNKTRLKTVVLIGARTKNQILCEKEFKKLGCVVKIATDDGSKGYKGRVTELLKETLNSQSSIGVYACGPKPMLRVISQMAKKYNLSAQVSLEAYMACGFGVCLGCAVETKAGYKLVCKDGPVFDAIQVII